MTTFPTFFDNEIYHAVRARMAKMISLELAELFQDPVITLFLYFHTIRKKNGEKISSAAVSGSLTPLYMSWTLFLCVCV